MELLGISADTWLSLLVAVISGTGSSFVAYTHLSADIQGREQRNKILDHQHMNRLRGIGPDSLQRTGSLNVDLAVEYLVTETPRIKSTDYRLAKRIERASVELRGATSEVAKTRQDLTGYQKQENKINKRRRHGNSTTRTIYTDSHEEAFTAELGAADGELLALWPFGVSGDTDSGSTGQGEEIASDNWDIEIDKIPGARDTLEYSQSSIKGSTKRLEDEFNSFKLKLGVKTGQDLKQVLDHKLNVQKRQLVKLVQKITWFDRYLQRRLSTALGFTRMWRFCAAKWETRKIRVDNSIRLSWDRRFRSFLNLR